jgi:hypothetical protein
MSPLEVSFPFFFHPGAPCLGASQWPFDLFGGSQFLACRSHTQHRKFVSCQCRVVGRLTPDMGSRKRKVPPQRKVLFSVCNGVCW